MRNRSLPLTLKTEQVGTDEAGTGFESVADVGTIELTGTLSAGSRGWSLSAAASWHRTTITVQVIATETPPGGVPDLEYHAYRATITFRRRGRYRLRVLHAYRLAAGTGMTLPQPVYEREIALP